MFNGSDYFILNVMPSLSINGEKLVMCGASSMCYNTLSVNVIYQPDILTSCKELDGVSLAGYVSYYYSDSIDLEKYVNPLNGCSNILLPTWERSIIECIKLDLKCITIGNFCDAFDRYLFSNRRNDALLFEVADTLHVAEDRVRYWMNESEGYN